MAIDDLTLELESGAPAAPSVLLWRVEGREALSEPYAYQLTFDTLIEGGLGPDAIDQMLRAPVIVRAGGGRPVEIHGVLSELRMFSTDQPAAVRYRATLVPRVARLELMRRSRIFQNLSVPEIARAVLTDVGFVEERDFALRLDESYPQSEYVVQYEESDLAFLNRLLEHWGIFYFFEQEPGEGERIVLADSNRALTALPDHESLPYRPGDVRPGDSGSIQSLEQVRTVRPAKVLLRDYNWRTPSVQLHNEAAADSVSGSGLFNYYGEHFKTPSEGAWLARIRAEELIRERDTIECGANVAGLLPGHRFALEHHPLPELDRAYAVTEIEQVFEALSPPDGSRRTGMHSMRVRAIPFASAFRSSRRTPLPRIAGVMHARIDGDAPGMAAPIDEFGRYKVLMPFDLAGAPGGKASRWIRLAQPASGPGFGVHFPLHIGVEVMIAHVDGDPDRPVIVGSPPNTETITPVTRNNATQAAIRTKAGVQVTFDDDC